ncbi:MAG TPA: glycine oxidase ThiO [Terriglobales bacterium]|nr:glycine oxidase ThiO [Terriglobales bacterium]
MSLFYNAAVKTWDVIIVGGGIIGLSLSLALRKRGMRVLVVDKGELGREASYAAGGMLADSLIDTPGVLQPLATASAQMYPEFVHEIEDESGLKADLRSQGTIVLVDPRDVQHLPAPYRSMQLSAEELASLEPAVARTNHSAIFLEERSVDPRALTTAVLKAAKHRAVDTSAGDAVVSVDLADSRVVGVSTVKTSFLAPIVINCAGAWSGQIGAHRFPTRPVKGQMLCVTAGKESAPRHVVRAPEAYLIPRSDGRVLVGSTVEEAGFDKRTVPATIQRMHRDAVKLVPKFASAQILEDWAGLRPGTADNLPILGATATPGYYVATGHFRDGILLAPITARVLADVICGEEPQISLAAFSPARFQRAA